MNLVQTKILKSAAAGITTALLFPPYQFHSANGVILGAGWGFLLTGRDYNGYPATVDVALLLAEWIAIALLSGIAWALTSDRREIDALARKIYGDPKARDAVYAALYQHGDERGQPFL